MAAMQIDQEQQPIPARRAAAHQTQTRQTTMRASQAQINQEVAVALEKLNGLMQSTIDRVKDLEDERRDEDKRRDNRADQRFQVDRGTVAILISLAMALVYLLPHLHLS